jgi:endo-1,3-1,4-beta-glycanase ExoK
MLRAGLSSLCVLATLGFPHVASAVTSGELYTSAGYGYGRFEARLRFAAGDGVVSSFFLWKDGSEVSGTYWNELDFEKVGADCHVETNAIHGNPAANHSQSHPALVNPCTTYHTYAYEWTPDAIVWLVDGTEIRRETGATATAYAQNATAMQLRFNVWPGDATFGGNFSPSILPVHQYVDWVQYSAYENGAFTVKWREDFASASLPSGWLTASWGSPKNLSTHDARNVNILDGHLTISLTADNATGPNGAMHGDTTPSGGRSGGGAPGSGGGAGAGAGAGGALGGAGGAPSGGAGNPAGGTANPAGGTAGPNGGTINPAGGTATPVGGTTNPAGGAANPTGGSVNPTGGAATGGMSTSTGGLSTGGVITSTGGVSAGGAPASPPAEAPKEGGCSWIAREPGNARAPLGALGLAALLLLRRRRSSAR